MDCQRFPGEKTAKNQFFRGFADIGRVWARMAKGDLIRPSSGRPNNRPPSPQRLHRNLQKNPCGDFAEDSFRVSGNSKESSATRAANLCSRLPDRMEPRRGSGGKIISFFPRRLSAAFDARKRPPTRCTLQQQKNGQPHHPPRGGISSLQQTLGHQRLHAA